jgi:OmpA-OmpF porin, OOP family
LRNFPILTKSNQLLTMNSKSILTILGLIAWILFCNWWWCNNKEECNCDKGEVPEVIATTSDDGPIRFATNTFGPITGTNWNSFSDSICNLIKAGKRVEITGYYAASEKNTTKYQNLGIARADTIKDLLMAKLPGVNASRFNLLGVLQSKLSSASSPFVASNLMLKDTVATPGANGGVVVADSNDILIYFPTGSATKEPSKEVDDYLTTLGTRLQSSGEKALITGHTDNKGDANKNMVLSKERAAFVKQILVKHNAVENNLTTDGKAAQEPIGDNNTDAGRKQNRRVRIQISK